VALFSPLPSPDGRPQVAFAVSKRCGGAVQRNQIRRRLREAASSMGESLLPGAYLIRTEPEASDLDFHQMSAHLRGAVAQATKKSKERSDGH
jgi:ribonuclease P protein component